ncbi:unnamed protein product [Rotaria socialis]|uniref:MICOS complex subunit MIC10 n=1 Tax=Rotaria socialis TaxID=392032 RepID=A0A818RAB2_9BILA|nr:unnamed protein product [Rotaria socialis]CAF3329880.1 unnamed protein product [Rotaria socialis]CAF3367019.1 unnamed protein product [Rotaria socialis]CAF3615287.1 unnamed protein product [Rotaria socialis]CAF3654391.1 unnamed protein product [Rotaria socialis]
MSTSNRSLSQDNANGEKWDRCLTDGILKTAFGFTWGIVFSALLFKRRPWPIIFGTGIGIGMGYSNCQNDLRSSNRHFKSITRPDQQIPTTPSESE